MRARHVRERGPLWTRMKTSEKQTVICIPHAGQRIWWRKDLAGAPGEHLRPLLDDVIDPPEMLRVVVPLHRAVRMAPVPSSFWASACTTGRFPSCRSMRKSQ